MKAGTGFSYALFELMYNNILDQVNGALLPLAGAKADACGSGGSGEGTKLASLMMQPVLSCQEDV
ncbi:hypothetical protein [Planomicrobium sp. CPCC 101110]|uniref:hypothetical protein n=1 Tax=Planomicrobium sp. CPCC 101110 TaxID=2599619 RepID=UPI0011B8935B|nr:hypothetical protein [Planomicrobium sp. CPCC 101110]TWT27377.1 hypothetical protein FQV30_02340 [Planomicrobium sp. CPCC 101110]